VAVKAPAGTVIVRIVMRMTGKPPDIVRIVTLMDGNTGEGRGNPSPEGH